MTQQIGSQHREQIEETDYKVWEHVEGSDEIILQDTETLNLEYWHRNDDFAGYVVEVDGVGYEFARSLE